MTNKPTLIRLGGRMLKNIAQHPLQAIDQIELTAAEDGVKKYMAGFLKDWTPALMDQATKMNLDLLPHVAKAIPEKWLVQAPQYAHLLKYFTPEKLVSLLRDVRPDLAKHLDTHEAARLWYEQNFQGIVKKIFHA